MQSFSFDKIMWQKGIKPPPLCFAPQNIGEVSLSDGGVEIRNRGNVSTSSMSPKCDYLQRIHR